MKKLLLISVILFGITFTSKSQNVIPDSGKVGIGTRSPIGNFEIAEPGSKDTSRIRVSFENTQVVINRAPTLYHIPRVEFFSDSPSRIGPRFEASISFTGLNFIINTHGFLRGSGYGSLVGIGTSTPIWTLHAQSVLGPSGSFGITGNDFVNGSIGTGLYMKANSSDSSSLLQSFNFGNMTNGGKLLINPNGGNVAIGTTDAKGYKFAVAGNAIAESMTVKLQANWPDVVFKKDYALMPLSEVKTYIDKNQHLPEIPTAAEVEKDGVNLGEMNRLLVKKVEELTLYLIEKDKKDKEKEALLKSQQEQIDELKQQLSLITKALNKN